MPRTFKVALSTALWLCLAILLVAGLKAAIQSVLPAAPAGTHTPARLMATATASATNPPVETARPGITPTAATGVSTPTPAGLPSGLPAYPVLSASNAAAFGPLLQIDLAAGQTPGQSPTGLAWSPDGSSLAVRHANEVLIYHLAELDAHPAVPALRWNAAGGVVAYSPDGRWVANDAMGANDATIELHDAATGALANSLVVQASLTDPMGGFFGPLAFSPDGASLAVIYNSQVQVWDPAGGKLRWQVAGSAFSLAFSPDSTELAVGTWDGPITVYAASSGAALRQLTGHTGTVQAIAYAPDGTWLASAGGRDDGTLRMWSRASGEALGKLPGNTAWLEALAVSPAGVLLGTNQDDQLLLWDASGATLLRTIQLEAGMIVQMAFSPDGSRLASIDNWRPVVRLWAVKPEGEGAQFAFPTDIPPTPEPGRAGNQNLAYPTIVFGLDWAAQADRLLASTTSGIYVYDTSTRQPVFSLTDPAYQMAAATIDPAGQRLAVRANSWEIWDIAGGQQLGRLGSLAADDMGQASFSPDGAVLAAAEQDGVQLWNVAEGTLARLLPIPAGARAAAFRPDGATLLVLTRDGRLQTWDLSQYEMTGSIDMGLADQLRFSPDAAWLAVHRSGGVELWNTATGQAGAGSINCGVDLWFGAFDLPGQRLVTGPCGVSGQAELYPLAGGSPILTFSAGSGQNEEWRSAAFSPDGRLLALGNPQGMIQFFEAATGQPAGVIQVGTP